MDYVTISDHNTISGALEIAHLPGAFVSSEVTAYFPENGCKVHVVVLNVSQSRFRDVMELRKKIYELAAYLQQENVAHFLAHPLYAQNDKLTVEIIEKSLLLFNTFEVKNGCRARRFNEFTDLLTATLTEETIMSLVDKYTFRVVDFEDKNKKCRRWVRPDNVGVMIARQEGQGKSGAYSVKLVEYRSPVN